MLAEVLYGIKTYRNLDISVRLMAYELLGSLFDNLGLCEGPEGCHGDWTEENIKVTTSLAFLYQRKCLKITPPPYIHCWERISINTLLTNIDVGSNINIDKMCRCLKLPQFYFYNHRQNDHFACEEPK